MVLESAIVEARLNSLRNKNQPYLPRWVFKEAGEAIDPGVLEAFAGALGKKDETLTVVKFYPTTSVHDDTLQRAVEFCKPPRRLVSYSVGRRRLLLHPRDERREPSSTEGNVGTSLKTLAAQSPSCTRS